VPPPDIPTPDIAFPRIPMPGTRQCDVLVLGAGLAGLRAAWAAKESDARLRVLLVSPHSTPSGSSFANRNNALGMQAPQEHEADTFVAEVQRLAAPGIVLPELARALATDAPARLNDLLGLGLAFRREPDGRLSRFPACFSPAKRAVIFDGLAQAHAAFLARARSLGVEVLHGFEALDLPRGPRQNDRVCGARLQALRGGQSLCINARVVIAALGGPGPLFARRLCGPGGSGLACGLLASAGARLVNARYLQFFWLRARDGSFVNPGDMPWQDWTAPGMTKPDLSGTGTADSDAAAPSMAGWNMAALAQPGLVFPSRTSWAKSAGQHQPSCLGADADPLADLCAVRRGHCPVSHGLPDAALDHALLARRGADGLVRPPGQEPLILAAHAGNGGAQIDGQGRTNVPGLYACGECAGGMHGANRLGGGMVLSALVFGARAGLAAAQEASGMAAVAMKAGSVASGAMRNQETRNGGISASEKESGQMENREAAAKGITIGDQPQEWTASLPLARKADAAFLRRLRQGMDRHALPGLIGMPGMAPDEAFLTWLRTAARQSASQRQRLLALSALAVLGE